MTFGQVKAAGFLARDRADRVQSVVPDSVALPDPRFPVTYKQHWLQYHLNSWHTMNASQLAQSILSTTVRKEDHSLTSTSALSFS